MVRTYATLAVFVLLVALAAFFGARFEPSAWYEALRKPPFNPPGWVFAPVWSALYLCIALAGWLVWRIGTGTRIPLALWSGQLLLNAIWSFLFFGLERPDLALLDLVLLLVLVVSTTIVFFRVRPLAGSLFVPYAIWVGFAAYLNAGIWLLNR